MAGAGTTVYCVAGCGGTVLGVGVEIACRYCLTAD